MSRNHPTTLHSNAPGVIVHADWSKSPQKRWVVQALYQQDGTYFLEAPQQVNQTASLIIGLSEEALPERPILVGFDFPIGLPLTYAQKAGIHDYLTFLSESKAGKWLDFFRVAAVPQEISLVRPFYPLKPGNARQAHLVEALGCSHINELRRRCDRAHPQRRAAAPLFWTMGAQQVGKAALSGWQEVLIPALGIDQVRIWPFFGPLQQLLVPGYIILTETYPAEFYARFSLDFSHQPVKSSTKTLGEPSKALSNHFGKRSQAQRAANAGQLMAQAKKLQVRLSEQLKSLIEDGFGAQLTGEDAFDALVGLLGMISTLRTWQIEDDPGRWIAEGDHWIKIEGWIFGQKFTE